MIRWKGIARLGDLRFIIGCRIVKERLRAIFIMSASGRKPLAFNKANIIFLLTILIQMTLLTNVNII